MEITVEPFESFRPHGFRESARRRRAPCRHFAAEPSVMLAGVSFDGFDRALLGYLSKLARTTTVSGSRLIATSTRRCCWSRLRDFVEAAGEELRAFAPDVGADPRVNGSIFRIARDTRFPRRTSGRTRITSTSGSGSATASAGRGSGSA